MTKLPTEYIITEMKWWWHFRTGSEGTVYLPCDEYTQEQIDAQYPDIFGSTGATVGYGVCIKSDDELLREPWAVYGDIDDAQALYDAYIKEQEEL